MNSVDEYRHASKKIAADAYTLRALQRDEVPGRMETGDSWSGLNTMQGLPDTLLAHRILFVRLILVAPLWAYPMCRGLRRNEATEPKRFRLLKPGYEESRRQVEIIVPRV